MIGLLDATCFVDVESSTPDEAVDLAGAELSPSLCHQCAGEVQLGDIIGWAVLDESGQEVYRDDEASRLRDKLWALLNGKRPRDTVTVAEIRKVVWAG